MTTMVLVVDDDPGSRKSLARVLSLDGYSVESASSVAECLEERDWGKYSAVLLDRKLGDGNAEDVLPVLKKIAPDVAVVMVTGHADLESSVAALREGVSDYLVKPVNPERLRASLRRSVELRHAKAALRAQQARYRTLIESAPLCIFETTLDGRFRSMNRHGRERMGISSEEEAFERRLHDEVVPEDKEKTWEHMKRAAKGEAVHFDFVEEGDDGRRTMSTNLVPLLDESGSVERVMGVCEDVTERNRLQEELFQAQKMEAVGRLAGGIAHDFNNLLAGMIAACRIASGQIDEDHPARAILADAEAEGMRGAQMTRQLLDFSRHSSKDDQIIDLRDVVQGTERVLRRLLGEDVELVLSIDECDGLVRATPGRVEQVLMNLAVNARDAMPRGGRLTLDVGSVRVTEKDRHAYGALPEGEYVTVTVADTGSGMTAETKAKALEPFFTTKDVGKGTGLGLSSAAGIMSAVGGHLAIESELGRGTSIRLLFPHADGPAEVLATASTQPPPQGEQQTILVVEDAPLVRAGVRSMLKSFGYQVVDAGTPLDALRLIEERNEPVDLVLTDIMLPEMSGPELVDELRAKCPELRAVFMSAFTKKALADQGRLSLDSILLEKPFTEEELARKVEQGLSATKA